MSFDVLRFIAAELRGHVALALPVSRSCAAASACAAAARGDADGFQMKWMLQQTCQRGKNEVWERIRAHGYTRAALRQVILCWNGENKIKGSENIY